MRTLAVRMLGSSTGPMSLTRPDQSAVGIGAELDLRFLSERDLRNVVLVDIADDPDRRTDRQW